MTDCKHNGVPYRRPKVRFYRTAWWLRLLDSWHTWRAGNDD